jgi:hypothetical protein
MAKGLGRNRIGKLLAMSGARDTEPVIVPWIRHRTGGRRDENYIDVSDGVQVYQSLWYEGRQLTDFVLILQIKVGSRWRDVLKVDCCHSAVHAHFYTMKSVETTKDLQVIATPKDLILGCEKADNLIFNQVESQIRRWSRGR